ncbi:ammonium transporter [Komagataeibacter swingsii]|uniref:Ammonium transporter n=1 Tax=Komagataeibacter swingsii TaxID=215220 RepID=A0A2V4SF89_9PROT|nr:ammonium transporter [Komagataeibacter swingsii]PYD70588.1 ammonia channel protein [Komagataeibacter swingsii]GBQ58979.1 ammonia permease [Komagataeibacter swingsii DSM 16373]
MAYHRYIILLFHVFLTPVLFPAVGNASTARPGHAYSLADTTFVAMCSLVVMLMLLPGLALFYGGMARSKNVLSVLTQVFSSGVFIIALWMIAGYSLIFSKGPLQPVIGGSGRMFLRGITVESATGSLPEYLYCLFMALFATITVGIIVGSVAERMRFSAFVIFISIWFFINYVPMAHMAWGGGWIAPLDIQDFAGGNVVHLNAGVAGLVAAIMLGRRHGLGTTHMAPHDVSMTYTGGCLLFVGWLAFCGGCNYAIDGLGILLMLNTLIGGAGGAIGWCLAEWRCHGRPSTLGIISGTIAGLVGITPACGYVAPMAALAIGAMTSMACLWSVNNLKKRFGFDDAFDVFSIHGVGAATGGLLTVVFAASFLGGTGYPHGRTPWGQMGIQILGISFSVLVSAVTTYLSLALTRHVCPLRVDEDEEAMGLDLGAHGEVAYHTDRIGSD